MRKAAHGRTLIVISILAFIASLLVVILSFLDFYETLKVNNFKLVDNSYIIITQLGIDLLFAIMETSFGIKLLKSVLDDKPFEAYKMLPSLVTSIISPFFYTLLIRFIADIIIAIKTDVSFTATISFSLLIIFIAIKIIASLIRNAILKRKLMMLNIIILILSTLSLSYMILDYKKIFSFSNILEFTANSINFIIFFIIFIFGIFAISYYVKNPVLLSIDAFKDADIEILEETITYKKIKIYSYRGKNNLLSKISYFGRIIIGIISIIAGIYFCFEYLQSSLKNFNIDDIITTFKSSSNNPNTYINLSLSLVNLIFMIIIPSIAIFGGVYYIYGTISSNSMAKYNITGMASMGILILFIHFFTLFFDIIMSFISTRHIDISNYNYNDLLIILTFIVSFIFGNLTQKKNSELSKNLKEGDTYSEHLKGISLISCGYTIISLIAIISTTIYQHSISISYSLLVILNVLILIFISMEMKNPTDEYSICKIKASSSRVEM